MGGYLCLFVLLLSLPLTSSDQLHSLFALSNLGLAQLADNIRDLSCGWAILSLIVVVSISFLSLLFRKLHSLRNSDLSLSFSNQVTSVPPLIGYGTAQTLIGFAYGVYPGFFISAGSCLVGGVFSFIVVRRLVHLFAPFIKKDQTFRALSTAVQVKGAFPRASSIASQSNSRNTDGGETWTHRSTPDHSTEIVSLPLPLLERVLRFRRIRHALSILPRNSVSFRAISSLLYNFSVSFLRLKQPPN